MAGDVTNHGLLYFEGKLEGPGNLYIANGGTVAWAGDMSGPGETIIQPGGSLKLTGSTSRLSGRTIINEAGNTLRWDTSGSVWIDSGQIVNRGNFEISHTMSIAGSGGVLRNEGTLRLSATNAAVAIMNNVLTNTGEIIVDATTFGFSDLVQTSGSTSVKGVMQGSQLQILGGTLSVDGLLECTQLRVDSTLSLSSTSTVTMGQLFLTNTSVVEIEIGPTGNGLLQIPIPDPLPLNGTLRLRLANGFFPAVGTRYLLITSAFPGGAFARYEGLEIGGGLRLVPEYANSQLYLEVMNAPQPGQKALTLRPLSPFFGAMELSWAPEFAGFFLQYTTNLSEPNWTTTMLTWTNSVNPSADQRQGFFRLVQP